MESSGRWSEDGAGTKNPRRKGAVSGTKRAKKQDRLR